MVVMKPIVVADIETEPVLAVAGIAELQSPREMTVAESEGEEEVSYGDGQTALRCE